MSEIKLNVGSGNRLPKGWVNIDSSWHARISKVPAVKSLLLSLKLIPEHYRQIQWGKDVLIHDLNNPLPYKDETVDVIYASHIVEHLFYDSAANFLKDSHRVLKRGGVARVIVPDLDATVEEYRQQLNDSGNAANANHQFIKNIYMCEFSRTVVSPWVRFFRGAHDKNLHRYVYNESGLRRHFENAGFQNVKRCQAFESAIGDIEAIELSERLDSALCLEAIRS